MSAPPEGFVPLEAQGLNIVPRLGHDSLHIVVSGTVEMRDPGELLNPYWDRINGEVIKRHLKRVEVDLRELDFMNSSGILTLVRWIARVRTQPAESAYQILIRHDRNVTWQRTNVPVLAKLAPSVVLVADEP